MAMRRHRTLSQFHGARFDDPRWVGVIKFLFIVLFTVTCFLLVQSMVHHHFFTGGALNYRSTQGIP